MKLTLLLICIICHCLIFSAKTVGQEVYSTAPQNSIINFVTNSYTLEDTKTKGSPYLNEQFIKGKVFINEQDGQEAEMRFNAYKNEVEILDAKSRNSYYALLKRSYIKVDIGGVRYEILNYQDNHGAIRTSYFTPLTEGPLILLFKPEAILRQARRPSTSYGNYVPPTYIWNSSYYILHAHGDSEENHAKEVKLSKKRLMDFTREKEAEMKQFIKKNNLNLRQEEDALLFLKHYNSLIEQ